MFSSKPVCSIQIPITELAPVPDRSARRSPNSSSKSLHVDFYVTRKESPGLLKRSDGWKDPFPISELYPHEVDDEAEPNSEAQAQRDVTEVQWYDRGREHTGIVSELRRWKTRLGTTGMIFAPDEQPDKKKEPVDPCYKKIVKKEFDSNGILYWVGTNGG